MKRPLNLLSLTERTYRKVLALEKGAALHGEDLLAMRVHLSSLDRKINALLPLAQHTERLMREKITLQDDLAAANKFMAEAKVPRVGCMYCGKEHSANWQCMPKIVEEVTREVFTVPGSHDDWRDVPYDPDNYKNVGE